MRPPQVEPDADYKTLASSTYAPGATFNVLRDGRPRARCVRRLLLVREGQYVSVGSYPHRVTALLPAGDADVVVFAGKRPPRQRFTLDNQVCTSVTRG